MSERMLYDFSGKVALVTGAASGMGLDAATRFAKSGAKVVMADINEKSLKAAAKELENQGYPVLPVLCDVSREDEVESMVREAVLRLERLDMAYNNAGVQAPVAEIADADGDLFDRVIAVNLRGIWNCMKHELRQMRKQKSGAIVNCSSISGLVGMPGLGAYTASKFAIIGLTKSAALDYADKGIRINAVCPGTVDTPMVSDLMVNEPETMEKSISQIPMKRIAKPSEATAAVLWLCSTEASFMTGQVIVPDGGFSIQ
ncbi:MAG: glucose 1-dehydrogenase [Desulfovibrio sp.]|nr:glucose 1-dehydrogenase [Desulfovibrio sp.]